MASRVFNVAVRRESAELALAEQFTTIVLKSVTYDMTAARVIEFLELPQEKKIRVGDSLGIWSGPDASYKTIYEVDNSFEKTKDWLIVTANGVASDPAFQDNANSMANDWKSTAPKGSMNFGEIIPQGAENSKYALGQWARSISTTYYYVATRDVLRGWKAHQVMTDFSSASELARRLGITHYRLADPTHANHTDVNFPKYNPLYGGYPTINNFDVESWFRESTSDQFKTMGDYIYYINQDNATAWRATFNATTETMFFSPKSSAPVTENWARFDENSAIVNFRGTFRNGARVTNMTYEEMVSTASGNNMWFWESDFPNDEYREVKYTPQKLMTYYQNTLWWGYRYSATANNGFYNAKSIDFLKGTMTLARSIKGQG